MLSNSFIAFFVVSVTVAITLNLFVLDEDSEWCIFEAQSKAAQWRNDGQIEQMAVDAANPLKGLNQAKSDGKQPPPVHLWNPPFCGNIDMRIAADGTWYYMNSPIGRKPLYALFASVLRKDGEDYFLVTPVEKCGIKVDDAPFLAVRMTVTNKGRDQRVSFETNVDDEVTLSVQNPLRVETERKSNGLKPYIRVRANLDALVSRALFYDLVALGEVHDEWFGVWSCGTFFPMQRANEVGATA